MRGLDFALNDISLAVFTTLAPGATMAYVALACTLLFGRLDNRAHSCLESWLIMPLALATLGLVASTTHLGTPGNALYVFRNVGSSPLATEVLCTVLFLGTACSYWLGCIYIKDHRTLRNLWLAISIITAFLFIAGTTLAYSMPTVVTWDTTLARTIQPLIALCCMSPLALLVYTCSGCVGKGGAQKILVTISLLATAASCILMFAQNAELSVQRNAFGTAAALVPLYPAAIILFGICLVTANLGALRITRSLVRATADTMQSRDVYEGFTPTEKRAILKLSALCLVAYTGTFAVRFCFYCFHMTSGVV